MPAAARYEAKSFRKTKFEPQTEWFIVLHFAARNVYGYLENDQCNSEKILTLGNRMDQVEPLVND